MNADIIERLTNIVSKNFEKEKETNEFRKGTNMRDVVNTKSRENDQHTDKAEQEQSMEMNSNDHDAVTIGTYHTNARRRRRQLYE